MKDKKISNEHRQFCGVLGCRQRRERGREREREREREQESELTCKVWNSEGEHHEPRNAAFACEDEHCWVASCRQAQRRSAPVHNKAMATVQEGCPHLKFDDRAGHSTEKHRKTEKQKTQPKKMTQVNFLGFCVRACNYN